MQSAILETAAAIVLANSAMRLYQGFQQPCPLRRDPTVRAAICEAIPGLANLSWLANRFTDEQIFQSFLSW